MTVFNLARPVRLSLSGGMSINAPAGLTFETGAVATTGFTLSGATSGYTNAAVTYTVTPYPIGSALTSTVVLSYYEDPTPTSVPILRGTLTFTAGTTAAQTFTITRTTDGTSSVSVASALAEIGSPITLTTTTAGAGTGDLPTNTLSASATTVASYGQAFRQGALGAAQGLAGRQINPLTYWPADGSVKHAIVSRQIGAGTTSDALAIGTAASGATLTLSDLVTVFTSATFASGGAYGTAAFSSSDLQSSFDWQGGASTTRAWASGPLMSSWIFRKPFSGDSHLVAWMEVRLYRPSSGPLQVEVLPWIENGYLTATSPGAKTATFTFAMNGSTRFSWAGTIYHHTRLPLIDHANSYGSTTTFSHWLESDPAPRVAHDGAYLRATKLVPNFGYGTLGSTVLDSYQQTYTPNTLANDDTANGGTGGQGGVVSDHSAMYVMTDGDSRAWKALMAHALSSSAWAMHYRDDGGYSGTATNRPIAFASFPSIYLSGSSTPALPTNSGGELTSAVSIGHLSAYAYVPFLITGRRWFLDEMHFWATYAYMRVNPTSRINSQGSFAQWGAARYNAWALNTLAQAAAVTPSTDPLAAQFIASWQYNMADIEAMYVTGTKSWSGGSGVSPQGLMSLYTGKADNTSAYDQINGSDYWWEAAWMQDYWSLVLGFAYQLGIQQSAGASASHLASRNHAMKLPIGRANDGASGRYNWRHFIQYQYPVGVDGTGLPPDTYWTHTQSYAGLVGKTSAATTATIGESIQYDTAGNPPVASTLESAPSGRPYLFGGLSALAYAAEVEATDAPNAWRRMSGARNYKVNGDAFLLSLSGSRCHARWGITPRMPAWLEARAAGLLRGEWRDITSATNLQAITDSTGPDGVPIAWLESVVNQAAITWCGKMTSEFQRMSIIATTAGYSSESGGLHSKRITLDLTTGQFSATWSPLGVATGHCWDKNTTQPHNGYIYFGAGAFPQNVYKANVIDRTFSYYANTVNGVSIAGSSDIFPEMGSAGSLIYASAASISKIDLSTGAASSVGTLANAGGYTVACYLRGLGRVVVGGGFETNKRLYTVNSAGAITECVSAPPTGVPGIGPDSGGGPTIFVPDPLNRAKAWLFDRNTTGKLYLLDIDTTTYAGTWTEVGSLPSMNGVVTVVGAILGTDLLMAWEAGSRSGGIHTSKCWIYRVN